jgi:hypothetical protein
MATVEVIVGNAPTSTGSKDERANAERFGYLVNRGDQVSTGKSPARKKLERPGRVLSRTSCSTAPT